MSTVQTSPAARDNRYRITLPILVEQAVKWAANGECTYPAMKVSATAACAVGFRFTTGEICVLARASIWPLLALPVPYKWSRGLFSAEVNIPLCEGSLFHLVPKFRIRGILRLLPNIPLWRGAKGWPLLALWLELNTSGKGCPECLLNFSCDLRNCVLRCCRHNVQFKNAIM
jgi:hypothetical protein